MMFKRVFKFDVRTLSYDINTHSDSCRVLHVFLLQVAKPLDVKTKFHNLEV